MSRTIKSLLALTLLMAIAFAGCGYPQTGPENLDLLSSLRTAISTKSNDWLDKNEELVEERRAEGCMSDDAYESFRSIIQKARDGDWAKAEKMTIAYQKSQRPTAGDHAGHSHEH